MTDHGALAFLVAALAAFLVPFLTVSAAASAQAREPLPIVSPPERGAEPARSVAGEDTASGTFSLHPFVSNALGNRRSMRTMATGEDGGTYVAHVPQAFGFTVKTPL